MKESLKGHAASAGAYAIFGVNILFCKDIAACGIVSPIVLFTLRAAGAAMLFFLVSIFCPREKVAPKDLLPIAVASLVGLFIPQLTFLLACTMTSTLDISILSTLSPIFTMFVAAIVLKEPITVKKAGGVAMSFAGVMFLIFNCIVRDNGIADSSPLGIVLMLLNALSFASYLGIFRPLISRYSVVTFMKWMFLFALIFSLPFSLKGLFTTDFHALQPKVLLEIGFLIVFATFVAYFLIPVGQKHIRPTLVSLYSYLQPIIAAGIAIASGMDTLSFKKVVSALLVVGGVVIVSRSRSAQQ